MVCVQIIALCVPSCVTVGNGWTSLPLLSHIQEMGTVSLRLEMRVKDPVPHRRALILLMADSLDLEEAPSTPGCLLELLCTGAYPWALLCSLKGVSRDH